MRMNNKKGVSTIVTVVLLILVSITAVALIAAFVVPFIKGSLSESQECFAVLGKLEVVTGDYTCQNKATDLGTFVQIKRGFAKDIEVKSLAVVMAGEGKSKKFDLVPGTKSDSFGEYVNDTEYGFNKTIGIPGEGEERTYSFNLTAANFRTLVDTVQISAVLKSDKVCEPVVVQIPDCSA